MNPYADRITPKTSAFGGIMTTFSNRKIVAPIDFCADSRWGVETALEIAGDPKLVHLIHVAVAVDELPPAVSWDPHEEGSIRRQILDHFRTAFPEASFREMPLEIRFGDPGQQIVNFAKEVGAELIVLPSKGRTGLSHLLLGSVAERVARFADCPVLILRR
jgi:nucleotide-binding universal stress UspA family protein